MQWSVEQWVEQQWVVVPWWVAQRSVAQTQGVGRVEKDLTEGIEPERGRFAQVHPTLFS